MVKLNYGRVAFINKYFVTDGDIFILASIFNYFDLAHFPQLRLKTVLNPACLVFLVMTFCWGDPLCMLPTHIMKTFLASNRPVLVLYTQFLVDLPFLVNNPNLLRLVCCVGSYSVACVVQNVPVLDVLFYCTSTASEPNSHSRKPLLYPLH